MQKLTQQQLDDLTAEMHEFMESSGRKNFPTNKAEELREMGTKRCGRCKEVKNLEAFNKNSGTRDGLMGRCKACHCAGTADYKKRNYSKVLESQRNYRTANRERIIEYLREYNHIRYRTDELYRMSSQLERGYRRAVEAGNEAEKITPEELLQHWKNQGINPLRCYLTGEPLTPRSRSLDHVVAISNGGEHVVENLMPATFEANMKKRNLSPDDAREKLSTE